MTNTTDTDFARDQHDWYGKISCVLPPTHSITRMFVLRVKVQYTIKTFIIWLVTWILLLTLGACARELQSVCTFLFCLSAHYSYFVSGLWDGLSWSISFLLLSLAMHMYMYTCVYMYVQCNTDFAESLLSREVDNQAVNKVPFVGHCHNIAIAPPHSATPKCIHISYIWALQGEYQRAHMDPRNAKRITQALQTEGLGTRLSAFMR